MRTPGTPIRQISGSAIAIRGNNVDTDQIIPARHLRAITFDGLGQFVFEDVRKAVGAAHPFEDERFAAAKILVVNDNFGSGSSREHAPQALARWGIEAIVGESFAEIFFGIATTLGLPLVTVPATLAARLQDLIERQPQTGLHLDIEAPSLTFGSEKVAVELPAATRDSLLSGRWDALSELLAAAAGGPTRLRTFALRHRLFGIIAAAWPHITSSWLPATASVPKSSPKRAARLRRSVSILAARFSFSQVLIGAASIAASGVEITDEVIDQCQAADSVLLGACGVAGGAAVNGRHPERAVLALRTELGLWTNIRPLRIFEPIIDSSPVKPEILRGVDMVVLRELTGGIYYATPRGRLTVDGEPAARDTLLYRKSEVERIGHRAFQMAASRSGKVTSVDKQNVLESSAFWHEVMSSVAAQYPGVGFDQILVGRLRDAADSVAARF